jgi:hypothetical protein
MDLSCAGWLYCIICNIMWFISVEKCKFIIGILWKHVFWVTWRLIIILILLLIFFSIFVQILYMWNWDDIGFFVMKINEKLASLSHVRWLFLMFCRPACARFSMVLSHIWNNMFMKMNVLRWCLVEICYTSRRLVFSSGILVEKWKLWSMLFEQMCSLHYFKFYLWCLEMSYMFYFIDFYHQCCL